MMGGEKLRRKGQVLEAADGSLLLVNEDKQGFRVGEGVVVIWDMCEGRTEEEVSRELASRSELDLEQIKPIVAEIVAKLKEAKLVE